MNAPDSAIFVPPLAPLSAHAALGSAARVGLESAPESHWTLGLAALEPDGDQPFIRGCDPTPLENCRWLAVSESAAGLIDQTADRLTQSPEWLAVLSGCAAPRHMQPYASVYAGHQFGVFVPRLGDGRALNLGALSGWELQLKGAGPTPYARFADGRAVLRSSIREFLGSEAMHGLGFPTTRALSLIGSSSPVLRETVETAAVVCRLAPSFVRFGHFEYFSSQQRITALERLLRHSAGLLFADRGEDTRLAPIAGLTLEVLHEVARRSAAMTARWMGVGFMHGVMNTDNCSILGLTLDYGPFGFMDSFDAGWICNHSDHHGRYSFKSQPQVSLWNLSRLAHALHPLVGDVEGLTGTLETYKTTYAAEMETILRTKLGLQQLPAEAWDPLLDDFYALLQKEQMDLTLTFRGLALDDERALMDLAVDRDACRHWFARYRQAVQTSLALTGISAGQRQQQMLAVNPKYVLRNWIAEEVIRAVRDDGNTQPLQDVLRLLERPFDEHPDQERYAKPPPDWAQRLSVSCSS